MLMGLCPLLYEIAARLLPLSPGYKEGGEKGQSKERKTKPDEVGVGILGTSNNQNGCILLFQTRIICYGD